MVQLRVYNFPTLRPIPFIHKIILLNQDYLNFDLVNQTSLLLDFVLQMNGIIN